MGQFEKLEELLKELSGVDEITSEARLQEDLGMDSLAMVTLLLEVEERFQIVLEEADMNPFELNTVQDALGLIEKYCGDSDA